MELIIEIAVLLFAITIHEYANGKAALSLGDPTAKKAGRLTLNPIRHIDIPGAVCLFLFKFGWAKPVPFDAGYFEDRRSDTIIMFLSGPISNLAAALVTGIFIRFFILPSDLYLMALLYMLIINIGLGLFNLLPIPPFGGSHVLENYLPESFSHIYSRISRFAPFVLIGILLLDKFLNLNIIGKLCLYPIVKIAYIFGGDNLSKLLKLYHI